MLNCDANRQLSFHFSSPVILCDAAACENWKYFDDYEFSLFCLVCHFAFLYKCVGWQLLEEAIKRLLRVHSTTNDVTTRRSILGEFRTIYKRDYDDVAVLVCVPAWLYEKGNNFQWPRGPIFPFIKRLLYFGNWNFNQKHKIVITSGRSI